MAKLAEIKEDTSLIAKERAVQHLRARIAQIDAEALVQQDVLVDAQARELIAVAEKMTSVERLAKVGAVLVAILLTFVLEGRLRFPFGVLAGIGIGYVLVRVAPAVASHFYMSNQARALQAKYGVPPVPDERREAMVAELERLERELDSLVRRV
jgi:hypothetical protein